MHVREPEVTSAVAVSQFLVIDSKQVKNGSMQVVHVNGIRSNIETQFVSFADRYSRFDAATRDKD